jgi:hypothetical protein
LLIVVLGETEGGVAGFNYVMDVVYVMPGRWISGRTAEVEGGVLMDSTIGARGIAGSDRPTGAQQRQQRQQRQDHPILVRATKSPSDPLTLFATVSVGRKAESRWVGKRPDEYVIYKAPRRQASFPGPPYPQSTTFDPPGQHPFVEHSQYHQSKQEHRARVYRRLPKRVIRPGAILQITILPPYARSNPSACIHHHLHIRTRPHRTHLS